MKPQRARAGITKGVCLGTLGQRDTQSDMRRDASVAFMP